MNVRMIVLLAIFSALWLFGLIGQAYSGEAAMRYLALSMAILAVGVWRWQHPARVAAAFARRPAASGVSRFTYRSFATLDAPHHRRPVRTSHPDRFARASPPLRRCRADGRRVWLIYVVIQVVMPALPSIRFTVAQSFDIQPPGFVSIDRPSGGMKRAGEECTRAEDAQYGRTHESLPVVPTTVYAVRGSGAHRSWPFRRVTFRTSKLCRAGQ